MTEDRSPARSKDEVRLLWTAGETIERLFRYIEMIAITALIGVALRVVSVPASEWIAGGLALAAGLYLAAPTTTWIYSHLRAPTKSSKVAGLLTTWFGFAVMSLVLTSGLRVLLSQAFQIDEPTARIEYKLWEARAALRDCRGSGRAIGNPPARDIPACERRWMTEIAALQAKKKSLNP